MRVLLENTIFSLHKIIRNAEIIRIAGIIQGRALYEEIRQLLSRKQMKWAKIKVFAVFSLRLSQDIFELF